MELAIVIFPVAEVYETAVVSVTNAAGTRLTNRADQVLFGHAVRVLEEKGEWARVLTTYGYSGWCRTASLRKVNQQEMAECLSRARVITGICTNLLSAPTVHGDTLYTVPAGSLVYPCGDAEEGWLPILLPDGTCGYVSQVRTEEKLAGESILLDDPAGWLQRQENALVRKKEARGGSDTFSFRRLLDAHFNGKEEDFRAKLTKTACSYLGVQYCWGGRSGFGIDCSGLVGTSYQRCGVLIYRDAAIVDGFPLRRLAEDTQTGKVDLTKLLPGDAVYFPGHVGMYLGEGRYIHSTGHAAANGVVVNSLIPGDESFRQDLLDSLYAAAGLRL